MPSTDPAVDALNGLLRGEISATETYDQALERDDSDGIRATLRHIRVEHHHAVQALRDHIHYLGGEPANTSGSWGTLAKAVEGTATLLGPNTTLSALCQGEKQGVADYERAATDPHLPSECQTLIRTTLLPQTKTHVATLERMMSA